MARKSSRERNDDRSRAKAVLNRIPEKQTFLWNIITFQVPEEHAGHVNERTVAIIGGSYVEHGLKLIITKNMPANPTDPKLDYLFSEEGLLRTFHAKIKMAYGLGVINDFIRDDIELIRHIRNVFAHSMDTVSFNTPEIVAMCKGLRFGVTYNTEHPDMSYGEKIQRLSVNPTMYRFIRSADLCHSYLIHLATGRIDGVRDPADSAT